MKMRFAAVVAAMAGVALSATGCSDSHATAAPPPTPVVLATVARRNVDITSEWVASLDGYVNANIQPQVSGYLIRQDYREGAPVRKDEVLFEIDPRPFQAALDRAQGQLAQARGQLAQAEAQVAQAQAQLAATNLNVERDQPEADAHAIAVSQLDNDTQAQHAAAAGVDAAQAAVKANQAGVTAAQAAVEQAQLNLGFTQVRSLLDGVAGIAQVQIGNLVSPQTVLTAVSQLNPIKAYFPLSSDAYLRSISHAPGAVDLLAPNAPPALQLVLGDGDVFPHRGRVLFADRQVDAATGTIRLAAEFPNPGDRLRPGQSGRIRAVTEHLQDALVVPLAAVAELQGGYQVAVVGADHTVSIRAVELGPASGNDWVVTRGLRDGEQVVADGTAKVRDHMRVRPVPAPAANTAPLSGGGQ